MNIPPLAQTVQNFDSLVLSELNRDLLLQKMRAHKGTFLLEQDKSYSLDDLLTLNSLPPLFVPPKNAASLYPIKIASSHSMQISAILQSWMRNQVPVLFSPHWPDSHCQMAWQELLPQKETQFIDAQNWASVLFTSGSAGPAKALVHTYLNHLSAAASSHFFVPFSAPSSWLLALPFFHIGGLQLIFRALWGGATLVAHRENVLKALIQHSPTHLSLVDKQLQDILNDPQALQKAQQATAILVGGGPLSLSTKRAARAKNLPFRVTYGSTETCAQCITASAQNPTALTEILPGRQMKTMQSGEIAVSGPQIAAGQLVGGSLFNLCDANGFYASSDRGVFTPAGELKILGRSDLQFISGGENVQPEQIEQALRLLPYIQDAVVVPVKDAYFGHRPFAFLKLHPSSILPAISVLRTQLKKHLARHELPIEFAELPTYSALKIERERLRSYAEEITRKQRYFKKRAVKNAAS